MMSPHAEPWFTQILYRQTTQGTATPADLQYCQITKRPYPNYTDVFNRGLVKNETAKKFYLKRFFKIPAR